MAAPFQSTFTLFAEIIITCIVLYIFYSGYYKNRFSKWLAGFALGYEIIFNISYMVSRMITHSMAVSHDTAFEIALAAFHGTLSLIMFILLIVFLIFAWKNYSKGVNYFKEHRKMTILFLIFWLVSVLSGILFYLIEYGILIKS